MAAGEMIAETARFGGVTFEGLAQLVRTGAAQRELGVSDTREGIRLTTQIGTLDFAPEGDAIRLVIAAPDGNSAQMLRDGVVQTILDAMPDVAQTLRWENGPATGSLPSNFRFVTVDRVQTVAQNFLRLRIRGEGLEPFAGDRMHFRLVLPPQGDTNPTWPYLDSAGRAIWPEGDKTLHRPVYTVIACDPNEGWLDFDVYEHDGGRTTEWARRDPAGQRIGIIGPGGARIETASRMLLGGDETAFPALARTLEKLPAHSTGDLVLLSETGTTDYPFPLHEGFKTIHLARTRGDTLFKALHQMTPSDDGFLWAGTERDDAIALREHFRTGLGWGKDRSYMAAFWGR